MCVRVRVHEITAQTQQYSQARAFLWASRCFALTLPYLIKRDGSGPRGQSGVHTHTFTNMHTHTALNLDGTTAKSYIDTESMKTYTHKCRQGCGLPACFIYIYFVCTLTYREKCLGQKCMSLKDSTSTVPPEVAQCGSL